MVTGASGFIGTHIVKALEARGAEVHALRRDDACDIRPDVCIHAAWYTEPGKYLNAPENLECVRESLALAQRLTEMGCRRFIGVGTCAEYRFPTNLYAASKRALFGILSSYAPLSVAWCRVFYPYGPGERRERLVPYVIDRLLAGEVAEVSEGRQIRDYIHVADVGEAIAEVALSGVTGAVDIGTGVPVTVREVVDAIVAECGGSVRRSRTSSGEPNYVVAEGCPITPRFSLRDGIRDTVRARREELSL
jgi:nucleoside-diphosphate-sugar epimerase